MRRNRPHAPRGAFAVALVLLGCAGAHRAPDAGLDESEGVTRDGGPDGGASDAEAPGCAPRTTAADFDAFVERAVRASCEREIACGFGWIDWASVEDCARYGVEARVFGWARTRGEVLRGALVLEPAHVDACLDAIRGCEPPEASWARLGAHGFARRDGPTYPCRSVVRLRCPVPGAGDRCATTGTGRDIACDDGLFCDEHSDPCDPTCRPRALVGEPCDHSELQCATHPDHEWVFCDDDSPWAGDDDLGTCRWIDEAPRAGDGEPCGQVARGDVDHLVRCLPGLWCLRASLDEGWVCRAPLGDGASCHADHLFGQPCQPGARCDESTRTCVRRVGAYRPVSAGEPCERGDACDRQYRMTCHDGVCVDAGRAAGQPCDDALWEPNDYRRCDPELDCVRRDDGMGGYTERCERPVLRPDGARCDPDALEWECEGKCSSEGRCVPWTDGLPFWCER